VTTVSSERFSNGIPEELASTDAYCIDSRVVSAPESEGGVSLKNELKPTTVTTTTAEVNTTPAIVLMTSCLDLVCRGIPIYFIHYQSDFVQSQVYTSNIDLV
jgi:hypothetical protein